MTTDYLKHSELSHVLACLTPPNRLALEIALATGLRISDVLNIKSSSLKNQCRRISVCELKTGKHRRLTIPAELWERMQKIKGSVYVFEHRYTAKKHRTRQAVWKDLKRACKAFRVDKKLCISPHTTRKVFAVEYAKKHDIKQLQRLYQHADIEVTLIYALADEITARHHG